MSEKSSTFVVLKGWGKTLKYSLRHALFYICIFIQIWGTICGRSPCCGFAYCLTIDYLAKDDGLQQRICGIEVTALAHQVAVMPRLIEHKQLEALFKGFEVNLIGLFILGVNDGNCATIEDNVFPNILSALALSTSLVNDRLRCVAAHFAAKPRRVIERIAQNARDKIGLCDDALNTANFLCHIYAAEFMVLPPPL